jgi:uncharacterized damage-inducible protein DinB
MDFTHVYDVLTQARQKLFGWIRPLSQEQYTQTFTFGLGTLRATMIELAEVEWVYTRRLQNPDAPPLPRDQWPIGVHRQPTFRDLESAWTEQAPRTRAILAGVKDWDTVVEYRRVRPGPAEKVTLVTATKGDLATQMLMHEVHHRAQAMAMLRQLGVAAQNLDYGAFAFREREA